jgi:cytoskeleton protein RodZ
MNQATPDGGEQRQEQKETLQPEQQKPQTSQPSIGAQLAAQRDARGWTVEQVASQLNLAPRQIQALEQDNFNALPGMAIARGFIRAYAKLLKMDAAPLIASLAAETASQPIEPLHSRRPLTVPFSDAKRLSANGPRTAVSKSIFAVFGVAIVAAAAFAAYQLGWLQLPASLHTTASNVTSEAVPASVPATVTAVPESKEVTNASTNAAQGSEPNATAPAASVASLQAAAPEAAPAAQSAAGKNTLVLKMREESWVEIRRAGEAAPGGSNILLSRLERAGTAETFEVTEPVVVTIGNASGVEATLRGEPLDLKPNAKSNVARLNLK